MIECSLPFLKDDHVATAPRSASFGTRGSSATSTTPCPARCPRARCDLQTPSLLPGSGNFDVRRQCLHRDNRTTAAKHANLCLEVGHRGRAVDTPAHGHPGSSCSHASSTTLNSAFPKRHGFSVAGQLPVPRRPYGRTSAECGGNLALRVTCRSDLDWASENGSGWPALRAVRARPPQKVAGALRRLAAKRGDSAR
jgi:hypothetical protein